MPGETLVLAHEPSDQEVVHVPPHLSHRRSVKSTVVVLPTPENRIEHFREITQLFVALELEMPTPDRLSHRLEGVTADGW